MTIARRRSLIARARARAAAANPDAPSRATRAEPRSPQAAPGEPAAPPRRPRARQRRRPHVQRPRPQGALAAFARAVHQLELPTLAATGSGRSPRCPSAPRAAPSSRPPPPARRDQHDRAGHIHNSGRVVSVAADLAQHGHVGDRHARADQAAAGSTKACPPATTSRSRSSRASPAATRSANGCRRAERSRRRSAGAERLPAGRRRHLLKAYAALWTATLGTRHGGRRSPGAAREHLRSALALHAQPQARHRARRRDGCSRSPRTTSRSPAWPLLLGPDAAADTAFRQTGRGQPRARMRCWRNTLPVGAALGGLRDRAAPLRAAAAARVGGPRGRLRQLAHASDGELLSMRERLERLAFVLADARDRGSRWRPTRSRTGEAAADILPPAALAGALASLDEMFDAPRAPCKKTCKNLGSLQRTSQAFRNIGLGQG